MARPKSKVLPRTITICGLVIKGRNLGVPDDAIDESVDGPTYERTFKKGRTSFVLWVQRQRLDDSEVAGDGGFFWSAGLSVEQFGNHVDELIHIPSPRDLGRAVSTLQSRVRSLLAALSVLT